MALNGAVGGSYLEETFWKESQSWKDKGGICYWSGWSGGAFSDLAHAEVEGATLLKWSDYMSKEEKMEESKMFENGQDDCLDLDKLTEEQSNILLTMYNGFKEENLKFQSRLDNDFLALRNSETNRMLKANEVPLGIAENCFDLGLSASTEEESLRLYKYLLVRKELLEWVSNCPEKVDYNNKSQSKYVIACDYKEETLSFNLVDSCIHSDIVFTDLNIGLQALARIGNERIIQDYFRLGY